jgi:esterase/lipase superfamily enzyme
MKQSSVRLFAVTSLFAGLLAGCAGMESATESADNFPSDIAAKAELIAVTTRKAASDPRKEPYFGPERSEPSIVRIGLTSPYRAGRFSLAATGLADWRISNIEPVPVLTAGLSPDGSDRRDVLLYVHGFNETFESAALDAARLSDALKFRGNTVLFSWPSRNSVLGYMSDRESAAFSRDALDDTLDDLLSSPNVGRVNIVAHSMGGMLTVEALRQVHARNKGYMSRFGAIVFAAPDIDVDSFSGSVRRLGSLSRQMTVISATDDRALAISASLAGGRRVGRVEKTALEKLGLTVVDASGLSGGLLRHDQFLNDASVQKVVGEAIRNAKGGPGALAPSPVPIFEASPPPVTSEPLAAPIAAPAPAEPPPATVPPGPISSVPVSPAPAQPLASAQ